MNLEEIITVSGKSGLFKRISETRQGLLVESLSDGRRMPVFASERSSVLEDIGIYTQEKEIPLKEVFWKIHEHTKGNPAPGPKSHPDDLKNAFAEVLPEYDRDRVHVSDIKKVFSWYNILLEKGLITKPEEEDPGEDPSGNAEGEGEDKN